MNVKSASRVLDVVELFAREQQPLVLTKLARALGTPLSSCFNLVRVLESRGYLYAVGDSRQIYPTRKLFELSRRIVEAEPWIAQLEPKLAALREKTRETIILGRRQGAQAVYLLVLEGPQNIRYSAAAGDLKPLHASAIGKALLSAADCKERTSVLDELVLDRRTERTITDRDRLVEDLESSAEHGYAVTRGENVPDVMAVAAPVRLGGDLYAVAIAGPMHRMEHRFEEHRRLLQSSFGEDAASPSARAA